MKKILFLLALACSTLLASQMGVVYGLDPNGDGFLSIRNSPKGNEIGRLYNGNKVEILSRSGKRYKIKNINTGQVGWSHSNWIRKISNVSTSSTSAKSLNKKGVVHGLDPNGDGFLALRSKYKVGRQIGKLYEGDKVKILDKRGKWYKVKTTSTGQVGWAHGNWVKVVARSKNKQDVKSIKKIYQYDTFINPSEKACSSRAYYGYKDESTKYGCKTNGMKVYSVCAAMGLEAVSIYDLTKIVHKCGGKIGDGFITDSSYRECIKKHNIDIKGKYITRSSTPVYGGLTYSLDFSNTSVIPYDGDNPERYIVCINPKPYAPPPFPIPWIKPKQKVISEYQKADQWNYKTAKKICNDLGGEVPSLKLYKDFMKKLGVQYGDTNAKNNENYLMMLDDFGFSFDDEYITSTPIEGELKHQSINFYDASGYEGAAGFGSMHSRAMDDTDEGFSLMCIKKGYNDSLSK